VQFSTGAARLITKEAFAYHVRKSLDGLHNPTRLQTSVLVDLLVSPLASDETKAASLRQLLLGTIEALRPVPSVPASNAGWLCYRILWLRYVQGRGQYAICEELGLSRTSYYRYHQDALQACADILWEKCKQESSSTGPKSTATASDSAAQWAIEHATKVARQAPRQAVDFGAVLRGVLSIVAPLANQQGIALQTDIPSSLPTAYGDSTVLRQILLNALTEGIRLATAGGLQLIVTAGDRQLVCRLGGLDQIETQAGTFDSATGLAVSRALLTACGGRFEVAEDESGTFALCLALPTSKPKAILIIDDDEDTIALHSRYLGGQEYTVSVACNGEQVRAILSQERPDLILLDVLMPAEDGWAILQSLKVIPETSSIPVLICSVLDQPSLALALGAAAVLRKPISQETLLRNVAILVNPAGSSASADRVAPADT